MYKTKKYKELHPDDDAVFVSPEGIRCIEEAINNLEQVQKEPGKQLRMS